MASVSNFVATVAMQMQTIMTLFNISEDGRDL